MIVPAYIEAVREHNHGDRCGLGHTRYRGRFQEVIGKYDQFLWDVFTSAWCPCPVAFVEMLYYLFLFALSSSVVFGYSMFSNSKKWDPRGKVRPKLGLSLTIINSRRSIVMLQAARQAWGFPSRFC